MWNKFIDAADPGIDILYVDTVKEHLRDLLALSATCPDRSGISHPLWRFYDQAAHSRSPAIHRLAATIETWWPAIEAAITTGYTNAGYAGHAPAHTIGLQLKSPT